jgi:eukaryotic-like serine/threonine-protein kinase
MMSEETNKRIGDYQILGELGQGGMGRVYKVRNVLSDRIEAMKVLLPDLAGRQELAARFEREIKVLASLNHPNIAALRTAFTADNQLVMVMEYVEGTTIAALLEHGLLNLSDALNYTDQVLSALGYAHQQKVIHRDVKPANMMLTREGVIKLMDFGIARAGDDRSLTMTGATMGSLNYMSPEQVRGEATDTRSDLYSTGISLYEMVTGQRPFQAHSDYSIMAAHVKEMPKPPIELLPSMPPALNEIILMAIAKDPGKRFQTANAFRNALSSVRAGIPAKQAAAQNVAAVTPDAAVTAATLHLAPVAGAIAGAPRSPTPMPALGVSPAATPVAEIPSVLAASPPQRHRGLYMTLGALVVLAVLVVAGIYMPRRSKTQARTSVPAGTTPTAQNSDAGQPSPAQAPGSTVTSSSDAVQASPSAAAAAPAPATTTSDSVQPQSAPAASPTAAASQMQQQVPLAAVREIEKSSSSHRSAASAKSLLSQPKETPSTPAANLEDRAGAAGAGSENAAGGSAPDATSTGTDLDELEREVDQLSNRAAAVDSSLQRLEQEQAASGFGLRGDMAARQASMKTNFSRASDAVQHGDVARARKYMKLAEADVEVLERFLGH